MKQYSGVLRPADSALMVRAERGICLRDVPALVNDHLLKLLSSPTKLVPKDAEVVSKSKNSKSTPRCTVTPLVPICCELAALSMPRAITASS